MQSQPPEHPAPPQVVAASRAVLDLHDPTLSVAVLVADSLLHRELEPPDGADRVLLFQRDDLCVQVALWQERGAGTRVQVHVDQVAGQVAAGRHSAAPETLTLELRQPAGRVDVPLVDGQAELPDVKSGLTSLVLRSASGSRERPRAPRRAPADAESAGLRTAWFTI